jgi:hypothetical protein
MQDARRQVGIIAEAFYRFAKQHPSAFKNRKPTLDEASEHAHAAINRELARFDLSLESVSRDFWRETAESARRKRDRPATFADRIKDWRREAMNEPSAPRSEMIAYLQAGRPEAEWRERIERMVAMAVQRIVDDVIPKKS